MQGSSYSQINQEQLLSELPSGLKAEIVSHTHRKLLKQIKYFHNKDPNFILGIIPLLKVVKLKKNEILYKKGDYAEEGYFILDGRIRMVTPDGYIFRTFVEGAYFGELEWYTDSLFRDHTAMAERPTELLLFKKEPFLKLLEEFPEYEEEFEALANLRLLNNDECIRRAHLRNFRLRERVRKHLIRNDTLYKLHEDCTLLRKTNESITSKKKKKPRPKDSNLEVSIKNHDESPSHFKMQKCNSSGENIKNERIPTEINTSLRRNTFDTSPQNIEDNQPNNDEDFSSSVEKINKENFQYEQNAIQNINNQSEFANDLTINAIIENEFETEESKGGKNISEKKTLHTNEFSRQFTVIEEEEEAEYNGDPLETKTTSFRRATERYPIKNQSNILLKEKKEQLINQSSNNNEDTFLLNSMVSKSKASSQLLIPKIDSPILSERRKLSKRQTNSPQTNELQIRKIYSPSKIKTQKTSKSTSLKEKKFKSSICSLETENEEDPISQSIAFHIIREHPPYETRKKGKNNRKFSTFMMKKEKEKKNSESSNNSFHSITSSLKESEEKLKYNTVKKLINGNIEALNTLIAQMEIKNYESNQNNNPKFIDSVKKQMTILLRNQQKYDRYLEFWGKKSQESFPSTNSLSQSED